MSSVSNKKLTELNKQDYRASTWSDIFLLKDQLTEEENMISETAANYAQDKLMTRVLDNNRNESFDKNIFRDLSTLEVICTTLHSGGKFNSKAYNTSGGLHGVGLSVVNALSEELIVEVNRDKNLWRQEFSKGMPKTKIKKIKESSKKGTYIEFIPDKEIFGNDVNFDAKILKQMAESKAYLFKGITINWELDADDSKNNEKISFNYPYNFYIFWVLSID